MKFTPLAGDIGEPIHHSLWADVRTYGSFLLACWTCGHHIHGNQPQIHNLFSVLYNIMHLMVVQVSKVKVRYGGHHGMTPPRRGKLLGVW